MKKSIFTLLWFILSFGVFSVDSSNFNIYLTDQFNGKYGFFGNLGLNICLPFDFTFSGSVKKSSCKIDVEIDNGIIKLKGNNKYTINIKYLGGYFGEPSTDGFATKVTSKIKIKKMTLNKYYKIGNINNPITSNVNSGGFEKNINNVANAEFSIISYVWDLSPRYGNPIRINCNNVSKVDLNLYKIYNDGRKCYKVKKLYKTSYANELKNWYLYKVIEGDKDSDNVIVLRNGDSIKKILKNYDQAVTLQPGIKKYIAPYVKNNKIVLKDNQFLYLFEFNNLTLCKLSKTCDYQDSVILVTINKENDNRNNSFASCSNNNFIKIKFNTNCEDKCYIPLFGINGGFSLGKNNMVGNMKFGIYYDCNSVTKEEVIKDYCKEIESRVIKNGIERKCSDGFLSPTFWLCNAFSMMNEIWSNMDIVWSKIDSNNWANFIAMNPFDDVFKHKKYIAVFENSSDNEIFYNTYCVNENYKKEYKICYNNESKKVKMYDLYKYLDRGALWGSCPNNDSNDSEYKYVVGDKICKARVKKVIYEEKDHKEKDHEEKDHEEKREGYEYGEYIYYACIEKREKQSNTTNKANNKGSNNKEKEKSPFIRVDKDNSAIILEFGKNYQLFR